MLNETVDTAPAPHYPHTEFRTGGEVAAVCACGWRRVASSHDHSWELCQEHQREQAARLDRESTEQE